MLDISRESEAISVVHLKKWISKNVSCFLKINILCFLKIVLIVHFPFAGIIVKAKPIATVLILINVAIRNRFITTSTIHA